MTIDGQLQRRGSDGVYFGNVPRHFSGTSWLLTLDVALFREMSLNYLKQVLFLICVNTFYKKRSLNVYKGNCDKYSTKIR